MADGWFEDCGFLGHTPKMVETVRSWTTAMGRGLICRCPACGHGRIFKSYIKIADSCGFCGEDLYHHRADDAPPYFTTFIVGHIVIPSMIIVERVWKPEIWLHMALWLPFTAILSLGLLPAVKGSIVGLQWALRMHGFGTSPDESPSPNA